MSPAHLALIRQLPSCLSGKGPPCDPHHLRVPSERGVGLKATDRWAVPLTRVEHEECHTVGSRKEELWFIARGCDVYSLANGLWQQTGDLERMLRVLEAHYERKGS
jgi:hypothetical protein